jgi:quercetin dioxygenase-like cupin family protein
MDVIVTVVTVPPGGNLPKHIHPGEEAVLRARRRNA